MNIISDSITGQTDDFIAKLNPNLIDKQIELYEGFSLDHLRPGEPHLFILPSYEEYPHFEEALEAVEFLGTENIVGIVGTGNINFDDLYLVTAKRLAEATGLPLLHGFEFSGTSKDVEIVEAILRQDK